MTRVRISVKCRPLVYTGDSPETRCYYAFYTPIHLLAFNYFGIQVRTNTFHNSPIADENFTTRTSSPYLSTKSYLFWIIINNVFRIYSAKIFVCRR